VVVDPADVPSLAAKDPKDNFAAWDFCSGAEHARGKDENCSVAFKYGMKRDFNLWLQSLGPTAPVKSLTALREWNIAHAKAGAIRFGQSRLDISDEMDLERDRARFEADHKKDHLLSRANGIDGVLKANRLDAILTPGGSGAGLAARAGIDHRRAVRTGAERADPAVPKRVRREAGPVRRRLHGHGLQRAAPDRIGLRLRAGHEEARPTRNDAVGRRSLRSRKEMSPERPADPVRSAADSLFWAALCLAGVLIVLKAGYLGVHSGFRGAGILGDVRSLAAISHADLLFVTAF
jgi:hypothetical protein